MTVTEQEATAAGQSDVTAGFCKYCNNLCKLQIASVCDSSVSILVSACMGFISNCDLLSKVENNTILMDKLKKVQQENEELKARMDKHMELSR